MMLTQSMRLDREGTDARLTVVPAPTLPFILPEQPQATRLRVEAGVEAPPHAITSVEERSAGIVDHVVRVTDTMWADRAIGSIYDTCDASCTIYGAYGIVRSVEEIVAGTVAALNAWPDGEITHLNVAWSGDEQRGFHTSHLGHGCATNLGDTRFGPETGQRVSAHFAADCLSRDNRVHTGWLVCDNGAVVRQLGFDRHEVARRIATDPVAEPMVVSPDTRLVGQVPRAPLDVDRSTVEGWATALFHETWTLRRLDWLGRHYADDVIVHAGGGRKAKGIRDCQRLVLHILAAIPDGVLRVDHVCWSDEADGVIVAVRWVLEGYCRPGGFLGACPAGRPVSMTGISHLRLAGGRVVEEWMLFDEVAVLVQTYR